MSLASVCWVTSASVAAFLCFLQLGAMASLLAGRAGFALIAPMALMAALFSAYWLARREGLAGSLRWWPAGLALVLLASALLLSAFFYDFSWDGQWYHQLGVIAIAREWNPLSDPMRSFAESPSRLHSQLYLRHYAKGPWYAAATVFATTGRIEPGKCINGLILMASFLGTLAACLSAGWRRSRAFAVAAVVALNPVAVSEVTTFLVDGVMASSLFLAAAALVTALRHPRPAVIATAVAASIVCINSKFTGLVYLCFLFAAVGLWCLFKARRSLAPLAYGATATLVLGTCLWGYNPYVTNTLYRHQPFYPILGSAQYPSLAQQGNDGNEKYETPKNMVGRNRAVRFAYSIFGRPGNQPYREGKNASLMWPFTAHLHDLYTYTYQDPRVAALGPLFSGCFVLGAALGVWLLLQLDSSSRWLLILVSATIPASLLISKDCWWPRYGPQLWLLPIVPMLFAFREGSSRLQVRLSWALCALLLCDATVVGAVRFNWETRASLTLRHQLRDLRNSGQEYEFSTRFFDDSAKERLTEAHVRFRDLGMRKLPQGHELESVVEGYPDAIRYRAVGEK
ncbi:MAG: hypothetical protein WB974_18895 [Acidobacteriaceae bacterium]